MFIAPETSSKNAVAMHATWLFILKIFKLGSLFLSYLKIVCLLDVSEIFNKQDCEGTRRLIVIIYSVFSDFLFGIFFQLGHSNTIFNKMVVFYAKKLQISFVSAMTTWLMG